MKSLHFACLFLVLVSTMMLAKSNPVPLIAQPLVPASVAPGSGGFTLTVNGAGFGPSAAVYWNGSIRSTTVLSNETVQAQINAADVANRGTAWVTVANPGAAFSNVAYLPIRDPEEGLGFLEKHIQVSNAGLVVVGDFNNDGKLDVVLSKNGEGIDLFLGNGNGTFKSHIATPLQSVVYMVAGDFNGDGNLDLAVLRFLTHYRMTVLLGNGDGTFTKKPSVKAEAHASLLGVADFDGDGKLDLYVDGSDRYDGIFFSIKHGNGDGTFTDSGGGYFGDYCTDGPPAIGDFNGDGLLDLAAIDSCSGVVVFLNGSGGFQGGQIYPLGAFGGTNIAAADVNGDGRIDLVTDGVSVLLGNGDGTFKDGGGTLSHSDHQSINVGDFNGDGKLDIASGLSLLLGNGDGSFRKPLTFAGLSSGGPLSVGDFNGDGKLDLFGVTSDSGPAVFEQVRVYLTPIKLDFGVHGIGKTTRPRVASLTNFNSNPLVITDINITGKNSTDFAQTNDCGSGLPANGSCHIKVTFTPSLKGQEDASLNVTYKSSGTLTMPLTGVGEKLVTTATLQPSSLKYPVQLVGTRSRPKTATLTNTGNQPVSISSIVATAQFSQTNNCPSSLPVGDSCQIQVRFSPTDPGNINGTLSVTDDAEGSPQTVALSGVGTIVTLSPTSVNFGNQKTGTTSVPIPITLSNVGSVTLTITDIAIKGANAGDFAQTNDCGNSVPAGGQCKITVTFTPTAKGHRSAEVSVSDDGGGSPQTVSLAGTGT